jgi:hypothetical protein
MHLPGAPKCVHNCFAFYTVALGVFCSRTKRVVLTMRWSLPVLLDKHRISEPVGTLNEDRTNRPFSPSTFLAR